MLELFEPSVTQFYLLVLYYLLLVLLPYPV